MCTFTRQACSSTVCVSWLRCSSSSATICAHYQSANCRVQLVLIHLSLRPNCQVFWASWLLLLPNNWNCIMRTDFKSAVMNIYDSIFFSARKWARRDRWQHELNTACSLKRMHAQYVHTNSHMLHTPSGEFYNSIICFLRHTFSSPPATQHTSISSFSHTLILLASTWEGKMRRSALSDTHTHTHTQKRRCLKATSTLSSTKAVFTVLGGMTHTHTQLKKTHIHTECVPNLNT